ncbi:uncharacterized protein [Centruroides vittatus]|uniref:uncharacterized protein n=1 Tax=Centruroides vittatus TaxID=120091 RepID=UPI003510A01A
MDRYHWGTFPGRPMDHESRTPMAWHYRDRTHPHWDYRPSSPSLSSTSTDFQDKAPIMQDRRYRNTTLRSTRSVPALNLMSESCPVHSQLPHPPGDNLRRYGSMYDMRAPPYYPDENDMAQNLEKKSFHGSMPSIPRFPHHHPPHLPPHFVPPMPRPYNPYLYHPMGADPFSYRMFPPVLNSKDPNDYKIFMPGFIPKNMSDPYSMDQVCCKGHLIVLWVILGVVTIGVILGIVLGVMLT